MTAEPKKQGRKPGNRKFEASLQIPCTPEMREEVEKRATELNMTVPAFLRYTIEGYLKNDPETGRRR